MKFWVIAIPRSFANYIGAKLDMMDFSQFLDVPELHGLNKDEKDRIKYFLKSPAKNEFFFFLQMLGKTPAQVRSIMIDEFIRRFYLESHSDVIRDELPPQRSWRTLDVAITHFAGEMESDEHLQFWDKMRYILEALPQRKDYRDKYQDDQKQRWNFATCKLCWRRVSHNSMRIRKTSCYCFKHNIPSTHSLYRRHSRLTRHLLAEQQPIVKKIMALVANCTSDDEAHKLMLTHLTTPNDCLPRLVEYLNRVGHDGTRESLLWAFHGPASEITETRYREGLDQYIQYVLDAKDIFDPTQLTFIFSIDEMSRAEAWLTLLESDGRRKDRGKSYGKNEAHEN